METITIQPNDPKSLRQLQGYGIHRSEKLAIPSPSSITVLSLGDPLVIRVDQEVWSIAIDDTAKKGFYTYSMCRIAPKAKRIQSPPCTYYGVPMSVKKSTLSAQDYLLSNPDGSIPNKPGDTDIDYLIHKLGFVFRLIDLPFLPQHIHIEGLSQDQVQNLYDLKRYLGQIGLGHLIPFSQLIEWAYNKRSYIDITIDRDTDYDEYLLLQDYIEDHEIHINQDLLEDHEDDETLSELYAALQTAGFKELSITVTEDL